VSKITLYDRDGIYIHVHFDNGKIEVRYFLEPYAIACCVTCETGRQVSIREFR
jgi:hypothetical protein